VFGASIIEVESLDAAIEITKDWPEPQCGGEFDLLQEL
jgi:hypothetical protein